MLRDRQPIHNVGFGLTSREFDPGNSERDGPSPNSGFIARALEGNPITRMATAMIATGVAATVAGKLVRGQGIKLGYKLTQAARSAEQAGTQNVITRAHQGLLRVRGVLDELEGVSRLREGRDSLVFKEASSERLTTGYEGVRSILDKGYSYARKGVSGAEGWAWRDQLQQSLVRQVRRLPYEVPAFYIADKTIGRTLFGRNENQGPKKRWYDPSRVTDFAQDLGKTTLFQLGGFVLPAAAAGASKNSSLNFFRTAEQRWDSTYRGYRQLTPVQKKLYEKTNFLSGSLSEVGQDIFKVLDKSIKFSERSTGAMSAALIQLTGTHKNPVSDLYAARHGANPSEPVSQSVKNVASEIFNSDRRALQQKGLDSLLDLIPGYKAIRQGLVHGSKEYKNLKSAQVYLDSPNDELIKAQQSIIRANRLGPNAADADVNPILVRSLDSILRKRSSPLVRLAKSFEDQVGLTPGQSRIPNSRTSFLQKGFKQKVFDGEYKRQLAQRLSAVDGVDKQSAERFVNELDFSDLPYKKVKGVAEPEYIAPENRFSIGGSQPESDFFNQIIQIYNRGKVGQVSPLNITAEGLRDTVGSLDNGLMQGFASKTGSSQIYNGVNISNAADAVTQQFNKFASQTVLRPQKLLEKDFNLLSNPSVSRLDQTYIRQMQTLQQAVAKTMGVTESSPSALAARLRARGIDPDSPGQMQGYLLNNKQMKSSQFGSVSDFFGVKTYTVDKYLKDQQSLFDDKILRSGTGTPLAGKDAAYRVSTDNIPFIGVGGSQPIPTDPIRGIIEGIKQTAATQGATASGVKGFFQAGDQVVNINPLISGARKTMEFLSSEVRVPIINVNPLQLLGFKDIQSMSKAGPFRVASAVSAQPFTKTRNTEDFTADVISFHSTGGLLGTKGKVSAYQLGRNVVNKNRTLTKELDGYFRPLATGTSSMYSRTAELASGERTPRSSGATGLMGKVREKLDFDPEQPNSLFKFFGRLANRQGDVNNQAVMARVVSGNIDEPFTVGGFGRKKQLVLKELKTTESESGIDISRVSGYELRNAESGALVASHGELMEAFTRFANKQLSYGFDKKVSKSLLTGFADDGDLSISKDLVTLRSVGEPSGSISGATLSLEDILSPGTASKANKIIDSLQADLGSAKGALKDGSLEKYQALAKAFSRVKKYRDVTDFSAQSSMFEASSSIVTRSDEMSFEIMRYLIQRNLLTSKSSPTDLIANISSIIDDLAKSGTINSTQRAEAQASIFSTVLNASAFDTYRYSAGSNSSGNVINTLERFKSVRNILTKPGEISGKTNKALVEPFVDGTIASVSKSSLNPLAKIAPMFERNLGMGEYISKPAGSLLGGGSKDGKYTFIPTFGTALKENPKATLLSASGIHTYGNEEGFSLASVPISYGFQRLNRYFGTVGSGLKESNFTGPLDLYFRGMNAERILPAAVIGTTALAVDRTLGGYTQPKDQRGERVYSPLLIGGAARVGVEAQAALSGLTPGGMGYFEKKRQQLEGEVPIRKGRYWPLGNTAFKGGKIEYYRPSFYRKLQGGAMFTSQTYGSPTEKLLFHNDFSPLRPLDPYRFERKHYQDRPYPVTGEYFSGPFGAAVPVLNATVGRLLKPQKVMHKQELDEALASYQPVGQSGAYLPQNRYREYSGVPFDGAQINPTVSYSAAPVVGRDPKPIRHISTNILSPRSALIGASTAIATGNMNAVNASTPQQTARAATRAQSEYLNTALASAASAAPNISRRVQPVLPGVPVGQNIIPADIVTAGLPGRTTSRDVIGGEIGYRLQEAFGIYGFASGSIRESLGFGGSDFEPNRAVLQSASKAYGTTRAFWDLNLGGLGDLPLQAEGALGNIELSEVVRRFIPKERNNVDYINPIRNTMSQQYRFLPGRDNFTDFNTGDPFVKVKEGELRLPGVGYERFNRLYPDQYGRYGAVNQLDILADVAPYSKEFRALDSRIDQMQLSESERVKVSQIRAQSNAIDRSENNFSQYEDSVGVSGLILDPVKTIVNTLRGTDNFFNNKFFGKRDATDDYERRHVYGSTFPEWQRPVESFIKPIYDKGSQRTPLLAAGVGAIGFGLFGQTKRAQYILGALGALTVGTSSAIQRARKERFIPRERKRQLALEEYVDILSYTKNRTAAARAERVGDIESAKQYISLSKKTMYGADLDSKSIDAIALGIPKRKRNYFKAMIAAPESERGRILSTAPRLERRIYEAAWGMPVEKRPDLVEYFTRHELPSGSWQGWHPNTNMEHVKIKMGQSMGIEMSQMGYFPQQIKEANLLNTSYPDFSLAGGQIRNRENVAQSLQRLMFDMGMTGNITSVSDNSNSGQINIMAGVR